MYEQIAENEAGQPETFMKTKEFGGIIDRPYEVENE